ncbi:MAG TPA: helix-turn-helix transcriptional regulator [Bacteroidia bacterium]|nr:MAG: regulatory protein [Bacteroidetes bacterium OLB10]MBE7509855.1 helix-turn-helix transcriptional regulator [Bacteroidia bacterium]MBX3107051.1 helix-turn-helix transcriptional regulator [Bacteroidota bacterium]MCE7954681.1 XRE family transcriptional regulator [Bacteroidetes bacterium CHB6]OQB61832.1 MAG: anaerobic benzoate catabolism transcriptional regulator [Bacteroidetes bacterium ADurb.Bin141]
MRDELVIKKVGIRIRKLRLLNNISQAQLAFEAGIPRMQVVRIESGSINTTISSLNAIAKVLNVELKDLFDFEK